MPYFPQSHPDFNHLRHMLLLYGDAARPWTREQLRYAAAHLDPGGRADDWLFDSFLFLNPKATSGRDYCADVNLGTTMCGEGDFFAMCSPRPAGRSDWEELLEFYLGPSGALRTLDETLGTLEAEIGRPPGHRRNVVLMLPYPHVTQAHWGPLAGTSPDLDFTIDRQNLSRATEQRLAATTWFLDEIVRRAAVQRLAHVHLLGVYWMFESVHRAWNVDDHWLLKALRPRIQRYGLRFVWIPFWSTYNLHLLDDYRSYYFDLAFLQPNYMFYGDPGKNIPAAACAAWRRGAGLEMEYYLELDEPIGVGAERHQRFRDYLNGGVTFGYMRDAACAHFQGAGALERMHAHADPVERAFYDDIYHFVRGDYEAKPPLAPEAVRVPGRVAIAVDLGGTHARAALVDDGGRVISRRAVPTPATSAEILHCLVELVTWAQEDAVARGMSPLGIGVSTGGRVDHERGVVLESTASLDGWAGIPVALELGRRTGLRVRVDNDGHCAALAERRFGAGQVHDFVAVVVGTGIGGGIVLGGELVRGARNAAGELGHLVVSADGPPCACGSRGCVETYASGSGLAARAREWVQAGTLSVDEPAPVVIDGEWLGRAVSRGHDEARALVREGGRALGVALAGIINTLNPPRVILSGPVLRLGEPYLDALREEVADRTMPTARASCEVVLSSLDEPALLGAAALVLGE